MDKRFHPASNVYPLMDDAKLAELVQDIKDNGQRLPILCCRGLVIDGRNRLLACEMAGIDPWMQDVPDTPEEQIPALVESLNEHRRHLTLEQQQARRKARIERIAARRQEGASLRTISEEEGVSAVQVQRDLEMASTVPGVTVEPEGGKVTGKDGKSRSASKPKPLCDRCKRVGVIPGCEACKRLGESQNSADTNGRKSTKKTTETVAKPDPEPEVKLPNLDPFGLVVPDHLAPVFDAAHEVVRDEAIKLLRRLADLVHEYADSPAGRYFRRGLRRTENKDGQARYRSEHVMDLKDDFETLAPCSSVCPYCHANPSKPAKSCNCCEGNGWVPYQIMSKSKHNSTPKDYIEAVEALRGEE